MKKGHVDKSRQHLEGYIRWHKILVPGTAETKRAVVFVSSCSVRKLLTTGRELMAPVTAIHPPIGYVTRILATRQVVYYSNF